MLRTFLGTVFAIQDSFSAFCVARREYQAHCSLWASPAARRVLRYRPRKLKAKEAKNVGDILEQWQTFSSLADANMASSDDAGEAEARIDDAVTKDEAGFSRLSVGLAVREVN